MTRIVWDDPPRVREWVSLNAGGIFNPQDSTAIGLEKDGRLIAGCVFDQFNERSICMHIAGCDGWARRSFLNACYGYAFNQLKVRKVLGPVDSENLKCRALVLGLGYRLEATLKDAGPKGDLLIYSMTPEQCRWIGRT